MVIPAGGGAAIPYAPPAPAYPAAYPPAYNPLDPSTFPSPPVQNYAPAAPYQPVASYNPADPYQTLTDPYLSAIHSNIEQQIANGQMYNIYPR